MSYFLERRSRRRLKRLRAEHLPVTQHLAMVSSYESCEVDLTIPHVTSR